MIKFVEAANAKRFTVEYVTNEEQHEIKDALAELERAFSPVYTYVPSCDNNNDHYFLDGFDSLNEARQAAQDEIKDRISINALIPPHYTFYKMPYRLWEYEVYNHEDVLRIGEKVAAMQSHLALQEL